MANKEISLTIRAKNAMMAGLSSAGKSLESFGQSAVRIGRAFATAFIGAGTALAGFAAKAISAYAEQEKAQMALVASLDAYGEAGARLLPSLKAIAAAIQDETGVSDESTLAGMAKMKMLGVQTSKLEAAAKATIALKSVGLEEAAAQKYVAMAMQGNYEMLNRYIPALRTATSESEKAQIVNDLFARGYDQQKALLGTVAGSWVALKGRIGDALEAVGGAIEQNGLLAGVINRVSERIKKLSADITELANNGGMIKWVSVAKMSLENVGYSFEVLGKRAAIVWQSIADACETAGNYIGTTVGAFVSVWVQDLVYLKDYAVAIWEKIKSPLSDFKPPSMAGVKAAYSELFAAAAGTNTDVIDNTTSMYAELDKMAADHEAKILDLEAAQLKAIEDNEKRRLNAAKAAQNSIVDAVADSVARQNALQDKIEKEQKLKFDNLDTYMSGAEASAEAMSTAAKAAEADADRLAKAAEDALAFANSPLDDTIESRYNALLGTGTSAVAEANKMAQEAMENAVQLRLLANEMTNEADRERISDKLEMEAVKQNTADTVEAINGLRGDLTGGAS